MDRRILLSNISAEISTCTRCPLHKTRTKAVPGRGFWDSKLVFIGEAPGQREDLKGIPFIGPAGSKLERLLASIGLTRNDVYLLNTINCRPPENRDPTPEEREACRPWLEKQLEVLDPRIIVTLGRISTYSFLPPYNLSDISGMVVHYNGNFIIPCLHPAAALHNPKKMPLLEEAFKKIGILLKEVSV
jgi:uracil-DNA glycosylase